MVLEEVLALANAGFVDTYIQAQPPPNQILIPFDQLPRAATFFSFSSQKDLMRLTAALVRQRCDAAAKILDRPVRQEEAEAFAHSSAHAVNLSTTGTPVGLAIGGFRFLQNSGKCSFPGGWAPSMTDEGNFRYNKFGPFEGLRARMIWQFTRANAHVAVWVVASQIFFASYGLTVLTVRLASDGRLKEYNEALRKRAQQAKAPVREQDISGTTQPETFEQRRQRRNVQEIAQARRPAQQQHDDASPTGGSFQTEYTTFDIQSELLNDRQTAEQAQQAWASNMPAPQQTSTPTPVRQRSQPTEDPLDSMSTPSTAVKPAGSAWDRLRQQALDGKSKSTDRST
ncbi:hypothetical protein AMS68_004471 [Peltaster fructicola]|uniref:Uncharacterized protein n=1 Tax=Peltaster fructicola TaxID=286661 RepID=A0A6H0XW55_9PEZI|nr:hypothetical protein AMS68_004471 [Peltaster fructicola]